MIQHIIALCFLAVLSTACNKCDEPDQPKGCSLKPDPGPCEALIPKYYYDQKTKTCRQFDWGGCGGTVPFDTLEECKACKC